MKRMLASTSLLAACACCCQSNPKSSQTEPVCSASVTVEEYHKVFDGNWEMTILARSLNPDGAIRHTRGHEDGSIRLETDAREIAALHPISLGATKPLDLTASQERRLKLLFRAAKGQPRKLRILGCEVKLSPSTR